MWDEPHLLKRGVDGILRKCVPESEFASSLKMCHCDPSGGHMGENETTSKVLQSGLWWPHLFRDAWTYVKTCDACQRTGSIYKRDEMPQNPILELEIFDVWVINFMGPFPPHYGN